MTNKLDKLGWIAEKGNLSFMVTEDDDGNLFKGTVGETESLTTSELTTINDGYTAYSNQYDADEYARNRVAEYPSMADQLDDIYHNGIDGWKATIKVVKDKYPKE